MTDKQIIEENMVNAKDFCPHYSCQLDCYEARMCPFFVETLQQLQAKEQENKDLREDIKDIANLLDLDTGEEYNFGNIELEIKQLQAKEQECEELKNKLKPKLKNAHCTYFEGQTGLCKAKEFTRCNPVGCKLYTIDELSTIVDLQEQLNQLKKDNEQLKKYRSALEEIREDMEQDTTCESRECGCDDYAECLNCIKETILNKISEVLDV